MTRSETTTIPQIQMVTQMSSNLTTTDEHDGNGELLIRRGRRPPPPPRGPQQSVPVLLAVPDQGSHYQWLKEMNLEQRGLLLTNLLKMCAHFTESGNITNADHALDRISHIASPDGDTMQRLATYFSEAITCHVLKISSGVLKAHRLSKKLSTSEELFVKKLFFQLCPFVKTAYVITNQTIIDATKGEKVIQILDLSASDATQWIYLMQSLKENSVNPPYLKIIGIHEKEEVLEQMSLDLSKGAEKLNFPHFQFKAIVSSLENLNFESLIVNKEEPLVISCVLKLHCLLAVDDIQMVNIKNSPAAATSMNFAKRLMKQKNIDPSPDSALSPMSLCASPKMECFLNGLWRLQPRLMVITEQESNVNVSTLYERVDRALHYYLALFDCLEFTMPRTLAERILVERMLLGEEIKNIIASEGCERKERHEKLETWIPRLKLAGFGSVPINFDMMLQLHATRLLQSYGQGYKIIEDNNCLVICWSDKPLFSVSAWRF